MERFLFDKDRNDSRLEAEADEAGQHDSNLYDEDQDRAGERTDLATGKPIDNSTFTATEDLIEVAESELNETKEKMDDEADKWLKENDPDYSS